MIKKLLYLLRMIKRTISSHLLINYIEGQLYLIATYFDQTFNNNFNT